MTSKLRLCSKGAIAAFVIAVPALLVVTERIVERPSGLSSRYLSCSTDSTLPAGSVNQAI
jgi:hypothetical protein